MLKKTIPTMFFLSHSITKERVELMKKMKLLRPFVEKYMTSVVQGEKANVMKKELENIGDDILETLAYILVGKKTAIRIDQTILPCYFLLREMNLPRFENFVCMIVKESDLCEAETKNVIFQMFIDCYKKFEITNPCNNTEMESSKDGEDDGEEEEEEELITCQTKLCCAIFSAIESYEKKERLFKRKLRKMSQRSDEKGGCSHMNDRFEILIGSFGGEEDFELPNFQQIGKTFLSSLSFSSSCQSDAELVPSLLVKYGRKEEEEKEEESALGSHQEVLFLVSEYFRKRIISSFQEDSEGEKKMRTLHIPEIETKGTLQGFLEFCFTNRLSQKAHLTLEEASNLLVFASNNNELRDLMTIILKLMFPLLFSRKPNELGLQIQKHAGKILDSCSRKYHDMVQMELRKIWLKVISDEKELDKKITKSARDNNLQKSFLVKFEELQHQIRMLWDENKRLSEKQIKMEVDVGEMNNKLTKKDEEIHTLQEKVQVLEEERMERKENYLEKEEEEGKKEKEDGNVDEPPVEKCKLEKEEEEEEERKKEKEDGNVDEPPAEEAKVEEAKPLIFLDDDDDDDSDDGVDGKDAISSFMDQMLDGDL